MLVSSLVKEMVMMGMLFCLVKEIDCSYGLVMLFGEGEACSDTGC